MNIEVSNNGVRLRNQNVASVGLVFTEIFNNSVALRWMKELLFHPNETVAFYEERLFVSRSTLIRMLPKINKFLMTKDLKIQYENYRYQFIGKDEQYLRDFSTCFLLELYGLDFNNFQLDIDLAALYELILSVIKESIEPREFAWIIKDDIFLVYAMMFYVVSLVRENDGYIVNSDYPVGNKLELKHIKRLQERFPHIQLNNLCPIHEYINKAVNGWDSDEEILQVKNEVSAFYKRLFTALSIWPNDDKQYAMHLSLKLLYLKAKLRIHKTSELFDRIHYFSLLLKKENPYFYQVTEENLELFLKNIKKNFSLRVGDVLFWMCASCPEIAKPVERKTALLISDFGAQHAEFLGKKLKDFFSIKHLDFHIDIATYPSILTSKSHGDYDMLITTIPKLPLSHDNIVLINDYPSMDNFYDIYKALFNPQKTER